ncbi:MAG TPA: triose-phosphate isomerase [Nitrososphaerales archaeon]|nr:triose-phosphate isomerase [Nitrososphaerales archaeon]
MSQPDQAAHARNPLLDRLPIIIINFKTYEEATGEKALSLARICRSVAMRFGKRIIISPQFTDINRITRETSEYTPVFAQHIDDGIGKFTGSISPLAVKEAGAVGTLLNHSERRLTIEEIGNRIKVAKAHGLMSLCFADSMEESLKIASFSPEMIAYEPPELVGTGISVSTAKPSQITDFVSGVNPIVRRLVGAGISNPGDVAKALELGADGWGVSSAFTKAKDPETVLTELVRAS